MNPDLWIVKTLRQVIWHDENPNQADAELNRFYHQPGLMELISNDIKILDECTVRFVQAWFTPPPKPTKEVPNRSRTQRQPEQRQRRGFFGGG